VQNITKATTTAITFDTVQLNNGANSPLSNAPWWSAGAPTRLTAPVSCVVLASGLCGYNLSGALGVNGVVQVLVALNGAVGGSGVQGTKWAPNPVTANQERTTFLSMWKLVAGDFLELKTLWTGTPAGPMPTDTVYPPTLSLMMVALPSVP
jgi:hypothetical protein